MRRSPFLPTVVAHVLNTGKVRETMVMMVMVPHFSWVIRSRNGRVYGRRRTVVRRVTAVTPLAV